MGPHRFAECPTLCSPRNQTPVQVPRRRAPIAASTASVDLIYLDPPFNSNRDYNVILRAYPSRRAVLTGRFLTHRL